MEHRSGDIIVDQGREQRLSATTRGTADASPLFQHALLCQLGLPRRNVKDRIFERRSGAASLLIEAGRWFTGLAWEPQPLPFGTRPRIVMINLCAEAVRTRSRTVNVEHSVRGFLRRLNIDAGGYSMRGFKRQMIALSCCHMQLGFRTNRGVGQVDSKPISRFEAWVTDEDRQRGLWPGEIELSEPFYESLIEHAVPLEPAALSHLQNSAMALDVYCWLAHRLCRVDQPGGIVLSWRVLKEQFGHEFADVREFRRSFLEAITKALSVYGDARVEVVHGGLRLLPSPAPVRCTSSVIARTHEKSGPTSRGTQELTAISANSTTALPISPDTVKTVEALCKGWTARDLWAQSPFANNTSHYKIDESFKKWAWNFYLAPSSANTEVEAGTGCASGIALKPETLVAAQALANGYSVDWLVQTFARWTQKEGRAPRNPDTAFLAWIKSFVGKKPRKRG